MLSYTNIGELLEDFDLGLDLQTRLISELGHKRAIYLFEQLTQLPLRSSNAVTRLGSYSCRGAQPLAISLQFSQERPSLRQTLLHEIAHFIDHQTREKMGSYRNPHGRSWLSWLALIGGEPGAGHSTAMSNLYRQRLKPVARCQACGQVLKRLRRLSQGQRWLHRNCGGLLLPLAE